ncbi:MAG TPA: class I SAM-dependent methyltransferase [Fibrobacteria bacterium]|nr:class I SAM-dependent methyltransferase [Fibrobacteria bacterium]
MDMLDAMKSEVESVPFPDRKSALIAYRNSERERLRVGNLFQLIPARGETALDIGARDGFLSLRLAERFKSVTALDLERLEIDHPAVSCMQGDAASIDAPDGSFDVVLCAEVLEHIPPPKLSAVCAEIFRVSRDCVVIGVPYRQDTRFGRSTCASCGGRNPPWGHVNVFDEMNLQALFPGLRAEKISLIGSSRERTNFLSAFLMDLAGNPYGTYGQTEGCVHCGTKLEAPARRTLPQRAASFAGHRLQVLASRFAAPRPIWMHILFRKS